MTHNLRSLVTNTSKNIHPQNVPLQNDNITKTFIVSQPVENFAKFE